MGKIKDFELACVCGNTIYSQLYKLNNPFPFQILRCTKCGLARTHPLPIQDDNEYLDEVTLREESLLRQRSEKTMDKIKKWVDNGRAILDIGCGRGYLVESAVKRDWKAFGVDIDPEAIRRAKMLPLLAETAILNTDIFSARFPSNYFDAINIGHTFEHFANPIEALKEVRKILKTQGILIVSVPNYTGLIVKVRPGSWYGWRPQGHFWHFSPVTLRNLLEQCGFFCIEFKINQMYHECSCTLKGIIKRFVLVCAYLIGQGDNMYVVARKASDNPYEDSTNFGKYTSQRTGD